MLKILDLTPRAFWDVKMDDLDEERHADSIIVRVFEHGTWNDLLEVLVFYGDERVKNALTQAKYLTEKTLLFASYLFKIKLPDFKCFTSKQLHPIARHYSMN